MGKGSINLVTYAEPGTIRHEAVTIKTEKKTSIQPTLMIKIESNWVKLNNKNIVKKTDESSNNSSKRSSVSGTTLGTSNDDKIKIGNEEYVLQTSDDITDTQASDDDDDDDDVKELEDDDNDNKKDSNKGTPNNTNTTVTSNTNEIKYLKERYEAEIQDLIKDRERLEKKVTRLNSEKEKLQSNSPSTNNNNNGKNEEYEATIEDLKKDKSRLESKLERVSKESDAKTKEIENKNKEIDEMKVKIVKVKETESKLEEERKSKTQLENQIKEIKEDKNNEIEKLKKQVEEEKKRSKTSEVDEKNKRNSKDKENNENNDIIKKQLEENKKIIETMKKEKEEIEVKNKREKEDNDIKMKREMEDIQLKLTKEKDLIESKLKKEIKEANETINSQKNEIDQLKKKENKTSATSPVVTSNGNDDKIKQLEIQITNKNKENDELNKKKEDLKNKNEELNNKVDDLNRKISNKKNKIKKLKEEIEDLDENVEKLEAQLNEKDNKITELESKITTLQLENETLSRSVAGNKDKKVVEDSPSQNRVKELQAQVETLNKNMQELKKEYNDKLQEKENKIKEKEKENKQMDDIKNECDKYKKKYKEEQRTKEVIENQLVALRKQLAELEQTATTASVTTTNTVSKKEEEEEQLKKKISAMRQEKELESLRKKVTQLQRENEERKLIETAIYGADPEYDEDNKMPVNVLLLSESLQEWNVFEPTNEDLLSNLIGSIKKSFTRSAYDSEILGYWLSLTCNLYTKLVDFIPSSVHLDLNLFTNYLIEGRESTSDLLDPVPKFFFDLVLLAFDIYSVLLINLYSQLDHILLPPLLEQTNAVINGSKSTDKKKSNSNDYAIILSDILKLLKKNYINDTVIRYFMIQIFYFMDAQVFNTLLRRPDLFTASNGFQIKMAISQVEGALGKVDKQLLSIAHSQLNHMREVADLLVLDKSIVSDETTVSQIFSHLNVVQIKHILDKFKPDE